MKKFGLKHLILILVGLELIIYSSQFINIKDEEYFASNIPDSLFNYKGYQKINALNGSEMFKLNQGVIANSESLNGYDPIFPRRILWIVNAVEGRAADHMESVSLNVTAESDNKIYGLAGVTKILSKSGDLYTSNTVDNVFNQIKFVNDIDLYNQISANMVPEGGTILIAESDRQLIGDILDIDPCPTKPQVILEGLSAKVKSDCDFYWVAPMGYLQGWQVTGDNLMADAFPAFRFLQGYKLKSGEYQFKLEYRPPWWRQIFK